MPLFQDGIILNLEQRLKFYQDTVMKVFRKFYPPESTPPDHLIHATCTGYVSPSAAQIAASEWAAENKTVQVTHAYHMNCYSSLPAIRIARGFLAAERLEEIPRSLRVDVVHNELCSLHFEPLSLEVEQIVVQSLFADGHIKYSLNQESAKTEARFEVCALNEQIIPGTQNLMSWIPGHAHFNMILSRDVPNQLNIALKPFVTNLLEQAQIKSGTPLVFAIHPGGPKIIETVEKTLDLMQRQTTESHQILETCGNMSSATLPHIWEAILKNPDRESGTVVVSLGFGPGLTVSGGVFRKC
jgi:predicted naringenin-chalcone synthase